MSTEYALVCHDCKIFLNLGDLCDASLVISQAMKKHQHHNFVLGEDSDDTSEYLDTYKYECVYDTNSEKIKEEYRDPLTKIPVTNSDGEIQGNYHFYDTNNFLDIYKKYRIGAERFEHKFCSPDCKEKYENEMNKHSYGLKIDKDKFHPEFFSDGFVDMINESHKNNVIADSYPEFIPTTNDGEKVETLPSLTQIFNRFTEDECEQMTASAITHRLYSVINTLKKNNIEIPEGVDPVEVYRRNIKKILGESDVYVPYGNPVNQEEVLPGGSKIEYPFENIIKLSPMPVDKHPMYTLTVHKSRNSDIKVGKKFQMYYDKDNNNFVTKGFLKWKKKLANRQKLYDKLKRLGRRK